MGINKNRWKVRNFPTILIYSHNSDICIYYIRARVCFSWIVPPIEFAVVDADNKPIFGQSVSIYYEKKCWLGGERFQINVGTCGSHDLLPEERGYTMADFYIGIGKLHANTELLETIKDALFYYAERIADIQKEVRELDELVKNPTRA